MTAAPNTKSHLFFLTILSTLCLSYLGIELCYNHYAMLSVDEFWFAHRIYEYKSGLPYRDFAPYKTILGYYLLLPTMLSGQGIFQTLLLTKDFFAFFNMFILFGSSFWLRRFFSTNGILCSLAILLSSEIVISYSTQLRVDLPGYWLGFFALMLLLDKRFWFAGILLGLGFITTQKTIWYLAASNIAFAVQWFIYQRKMKDIKPIIYFNAACACVILMYLGFWSFISDWNTVIHSVFHEASAMYKLDWYNPSRKIFWQSILQYNPLWFLLSPICLFSLIITYKEDNSYASRLFVTVFALVIVGCLIPYKQVFPYYMQVTIPVFFILYAAFSTWLIGLFQSEPELLINRVILWLMIVAYLTILILITQIFSLPYAYLLMSLFPLSLLAYLHKPHLTALLQKIVLITGLFMGIIYPLASMPIKLAAMNGAYQKAHIHVMDTLLQEGGEYLAGIELIYNKTQPIKGMRHLMAPAIGYLYTPTPKLKEVMLASLYEDPNATIESVIHALQTSSVKFYVNNYRMHALPKPILNYLHTHYAHWWGSIYLYAPYIDKGQQTIDMKFAGHYFIDSQDPFVELNGKPYAAHTIVHLPEGNMSSAAKHDFRLKLISEHQQVFSNLEFKQDSWEKFMF